MEMKIMFYVLKSLNGENTESKNEILNLLLKSDNYMESEDKIDFRDLNGEVLYTIYK